MQDTPSSVIGRMNIAFNAIYATMSSETRLRAENTFYSCRNWLQERGICFHQTLDGRWVLDEKPTEQEHPRGEGV